MPARVVRDNVASVIANIRELARTRLLVGILEEKSARPGERITNAAIGYIAENGSAARNIPARPWRDPSIRAAKDQIMAPLKQAGVAAVEGKQGAVDRAFNAAGLVAQNAMRAKISSNIPPPLKPATIAARRRRSKGSAYRRKATASTDVTTLVDSGQFRNSVGFVVKKS